MLSNCFNPIYFYFSTDFSGSHGAGESSCRRKIYKENVCCFQLTSLDTSYNFDRFTSFWDILNENYSPGLKTSKDFYSKTLEGYLA